MRLAILVGVLCAVATPVAAEPLTYNVGPYNLVFDAPPPNHAEYVVSGTITTNGKIGHLEATDFLSWSISVDGPLSYAFHSGNPGAVVYPSDVSTTLTEITTFGQFGDLSISAFDNTVPGCTDCEQRVQWTGWGIGHLDYIYYDRADSMPPLHAARYVYPLTFSPTIIATRAIPEPTSLALWFATIGIFAAACRR